jgi:hypothetical protein
MDTFKDCVNDDCKADDIFLPEGGKCTGGAAICDKFENNKIHLTVLNTGCKIMLLNSLIGTKWKRLCDGYCDICHDKKTCEVSKLVNSPKKVLNHI